jgi:hypothetical protein
MLICFFVSGCEYDISSKLEWLDQKIGQELTRVEDESYFGTTTRKGFGQKNAENINPDNLTEDQEKAIDKYLEEKDWNRYGDPKGTHYAGGTPLFDEQTGESISRYDYILENHPEIINILK